MSIHPPPAASPEAPPHLFEARPAGVLSPDYDILLGGEPLTRLEFLERGGEALFRVREREYRAVPAEPAGNVFGAVARSLVRADVTLRCGDEVVARARRGGMLRKRFEVDDADGRRYVLAPEGLSAALHVECGGIRLGLVSPRPGMLARGVTASLSPALDPALQLFFLYLPVAAAGSSGGAG
jgi:hypothetical protein